MQNKSKFILALLVFTLVISNISFIPTLNAAHNTNTKTNTETNSDTKNNNKTTKPKATGYIYNGLLKTKSDKYGIEISQKDGTKKYVEFDTEGQKLAESLVTKAKLKDGTDITVKGTIKKDILKVISIVKKEQAATNEQTFSGWLGDSDCSPNLDDPAVMGLECLKHPHCEASGYGISIKQTDGTYKYYKFDANGHKLAKENIVAKTTEKKVPKIVVKGTLEENIIKVTSIIVK